MVRVLLVDDDPLVRETMVLVLRGAGYGVLLADDGSHALELLRRETVDLVISDILMPGVDGIELLLAIRRHHPDLRVLCISGGNRINHIQYLEMAAKLGAYMVLAKPFTPSQLRGAVDAAVSPTVVSSLQKGSSPAD